MGTLVSLAGRARPLAFGLASCLWFSCSAETGAGRPAADGGSGTVTGAAGAAAGSGGPGWGTAGFTSNPPALAGMGSVPVAGAPEEPKPPSCGSVKQTAEVQLGPVDIVWIIDSSASMVDELAAVQQNIASFATNIGTAGIDHHVMMLAPGDVALGTPLSEDPAHYRFVPALVDSHNALALLLAQYPDYQAFLRSDAALHFIVVSDDESDVPAETFRIEMEKLAGKKFSFHSIASEDNAGLPCIGACGLPIVCGAFAPGREYYALSDATGGQKISICVSDWSKVFGALQSAVIESAPLPCDYAIPAPPPGENLDPNRVNLEFTAPTTPKITFPRAGSAGACTDKVAWYYDDPASPKQIKMCPAACDQLKGGGAVSIELGCEVVPVVLN